MYPEGRWTKKPAYSSFTVDMKGNKPFSIELTRQEALDFASFVTGILESRDPTVKLSLYGLWRSFCSNVAFSQKVDRVNRNRAERKCYGGHDDRNTLCTVNCRLRETCFFDSKEQYRRCHDCFRPAEIDANYCPIHRRMAKEKAKRSMRHRAINHMCLGCANKLPSGFHLKYCPDCRAKKTAQARIRRAKNKEHGVCQNCGGPLMGQYCKHCARLRKKYYDKRRVDALKEKEPILKEIDQIIINNGGRATVSDIVSSMGNDMKSKSVAALMSSYGFPKIGNVEVEYNGRSRNRVVYGPRSRGSVSWTH